MNAPVNITPTIRLGDPEDVDEIMSIAMIACEENGFVDLNPVKMLQDLWPALHGDHGIVGIIGEKGKPIEGGVLLRIGNMYYSDDPVLEERIVFVHPDYRSAKGGRARKLCQFSKRTADMLQIPLLIGVLSNSRTEAKVRMYVREFGEPAGAFFLHGAKTGK